MIFGYCLTIFGYLLTIFGYVLTIFGDLFGFVLLIIVLGVILVAFYLIDNRAGGHFGGILLIDNRPGGHFGGILVNW